VLFSLLPPSSAHAFGKTEPYGIFILLALIFTNILGFWVYPIISSVKHLISTVLFI